jgi:PmbA protein
MRSVSQSVDVRDGAVEESQRSEGDDMGLRVLIGRKQAVVSTNDMSGDGVAALAERAVAMARVAPEDKYAGLADPALLAKNFPDLDLVDRNLPDIAALEIMARRAEESGREVKGVSKSGGASASAGIGGMVLLTSHGFSAPISARAIDLDAGDRRRRHRDGDRLRLLLGAACRRPRRCAEKIGPRPPVERPVGAAQSRARFRPEGAGGVRLRASPARSSAIWISAINGSSIARKTSFLKDKMGERIFAPGASTSSTIR